MQDLERERFNKFFSNLLGNTESCLMRDVLRNQKENLWAGWLVIKPYDDILEKVKARFKTGFQPAEKK